MDDKYKNAYYELKDAALKLVQKLEIDPDVKKNNWWLNERAGIMEAIEGIENETSESRIEGVDVVYPSDGPRDEEAFNSEGFINDEILQQVADDVRRWDNLMSACGIL